MLENKIDKKDRRAIEDFQYQIKNLLGNHLLKIALFGSKLKGNSTSDSDIDLLILIPDAAMVLKKKIWDIAFEVNVQHDVYISPRIIPLSIFTHPTWSQTPFIKEIDQHALAL